MNEWAEVLTTWWEDGRSQDAPLARLDGHVEAWESQATCGHIIPTFEIYSQNSLTVIAPLSTGLQSDFRFATLHSMAQRFAKPQVCS